VLLTFLVSSASAVALLPDVSMQPKYGFRPPEQVSNKDGPKGGLLSLPALVMLPRALAAVAIGYVTNLWTM